MKTIEVTDEVYDFLMELSKELNTQSNRGTALPYFFQIQTTEEVAAHDGCGEAVWHSSKCEKTLRTKEDMVEFLIEYHFEENPLLSEKEMSDAEINIKSLKDYEIESQIEDKGFVKYFVQEEHQWQNAFFTEKACREHIKRNIHHYRKPVDYLSYAFRNPELEMVLKFLCNLSGGDLRK